MKEAISRSKDAQKARCCNSIEENKNRINA